MSEENTESRETSRRSDHWVLWLIFVLFLGGLAIRGYSYMTAEDSPAGRNLSSSRAITEFRQSPSNSDRLKAFSNESSPDAGEFDLLSKLAPYLTEGGLSFFLGFCIGFVLRVVAKTAAFIIGGLYLALILLSHYGLITVDWGGVQTVLQQLLLNTRQQVEGLQSLLTVGIPSVAMGGLGIWRGLKKS